MMNIYIYVCSYQYRFDIEKVYYILIMRQELTGRSFVSDISRFNKHFDSKRKYMNINRIYSIS